MILFNITKAVRKNALRAAKSNIFSIQQAEVIPVLTDFTATYSYVVEEHREDGDRLF